MRKKIASVKVKSYESIDRTLKRFKKEVDRSFLIKELRKRSSFTKPSAKRRNVVSRAIHRQKMRDLEG